MNSAGTSLALMGAALVGLWALSAVGQPAAKSEAEREDIFEDFERYELSTTGQAIETQRMRELYEAGAWEELGGAVIAFAQRTGSWQAEPLRALYNALVTPRLNLPDVRPGETLEAYAARVQATPPDERR